MKFEKNVEQHLVKATEAIGGLCFKFTSTVRGVPDRIVIHNGLVYFVELKRPGGRLSKIQKYQINRLLKRRAKVLVLESEAEVEAFITQIKEEARCDTHHVRTSSRPRNL